MRIFLGVAVMQWHSEEMLPWYSQTDVKYRRRKALKPVPGYGQKKQEDAEISHYLKVAFCLCMLAVFSSFMAGFV